MSRSLRHIVPLIGLWLISGAVAAAGLQVSPVTLSLQATQNADGLWLSNSSETLVRAQVRVYHWTQEGGEEKLTPSRGLVISPPMLQVAAGDKQLIRVIRIGVPPNGSAAAEDSYRVVIDELPIESKDKKGLEFVMHYSVPVFVEPVGVTPAPQLRWNLLREGDHAVLEVANSGSGHAQFADLAFIDAAGLRTEISQGLLGYVLPGATARWRLKPPVATFAAGGEFEASINGAKAKQTATLADRPR